MAHYVLSDEDRELLKKTISEVWKTTPKKPFYKRRRGKVTRRSVGGSIIRTARVTANITKALNTAVEDWGAGQVVYTDKTTGVPETTTVDVDNEWPVAFPENAMVKVDTSYTPPRVLGGTCDALEEIFWGGS